MQIIMHDSYVLVKTKCARKSPEGETDEGKSPTRTGQGRDIGSILQQRALRMRDDIQETDDGYAVQ
ncbi:MAG: hypothetical protein A2Z34_01680 [Planctomycetes bacterium RBG_16_59_8]|nr:MAG: hypothetical protein A2Z34_01680 [Planctomycetes bacterium RBG_16_59_8]